MILCVTPNPAVDRTLVVPDFAAGTILRAQFSLAAAGGKGINVARAIRILGDESMCAGFVGGSMGRYVVELADKENIPGHWTWISGETRTCTIITDPHTGETTVVNEQGPTVIPEDWERLHSQVIDLLNDEVKAVCLSGSLPPGSSLEAYLNLIRAVRESKQQVWVDTSGAPLQSALNISKIGIKVNGDEAGEILGKPVIDPESALVAALELREAGPDMVVLTLGSTGAVIAHSSGQWWAKPPDLQVVDPIGSGDSFLAGLVTSLNEGYAPNESLRRAVAVGAANGLSVGGGQFAMSDFDRVLSETVVQPL